MCRLVIPNLWDSHLFSLYYIGNIHQLLLYISSNISSDMDYITHIITSSIVNGIILLILDRLNVVSNLEIGFIIAIIYIFSVISDIDHSESHISSVLWKYLLIPGLLISIFQFQQTLDIRYIIVSTSIIFIGILHGNYAKNDWTHRRFPHTFSFGIIICTILLIISKSYILTLVGIISFIAHIWLDNHTEDAIAEDKILWKQIIERLRLPTNNSQNIQLEGH